MTTKWRTNSANPLRDKDFNQLPRGRCGGAKTPKAEITQESPQGGDQLLSGFGPAVAGSVEHEISYLHRFPAGGVRTQTVD
jgi:hypothetical protein